MELNKVIKKLRNTFDTDEKIKLIINKLKFINHICPEIWIERDIEKLRNNIHVLSNGFKNIPDELKAEIHELRDMASHPRGIRDQIPNNVEPRDWQKIADDLLCLLDDYITDR